jgi:hypothetical protein
LAFESDAPVPRDVQRAGDILGLPNPAWTDTSEFEVSTRIGVTLLSLMFTDTASIRPSRTSPPGRAGAPHRSSRMILLSSCGARVSGPQSPPRAGQTRLIDRTSKVLAMHSTAKSYVLRETLAISASTMASSAMRLVIASVRNRRRTPHACDRRICDSDSVFARPLIFRHRRVLLRFGSPKQVE